MRRTRVGGSGSLWRQVCRLDEHVYDHCLCSDYLKEDLQHCVISWHGPVGIMQGSFHGLGPVASTSTKTFDASNEFDLKKMRDTSATYS